MKKLTDESQNILEHPVSDKNDQSTSKKASCCCEIH